MTYIFPSNDQFIYSSFASVLNKILLQLNPVLVKGNKNQLGLRIANRKCLESTYKGK